MSTPVNRAGRRVWFNSSADVVLFGENSCISTMMRTFQQNIGLVENVAIHMSTSMTLCCQGRWRGVDLLEALHGFDANAPLMPRRNAGYQGCASLKQVSFVVKTNLWPTRAGLVPTNTMIRSAVTHGITDGMVLMHRDLAPKIATIETGGISLRVGTNRWATPATKPKFMFVHLINPNYYQTVQPFYHAVTTNTRGLNRLRHEQDMKFVRDTEIRTGCKINPPCNQVTGQEPREIGFAGSVGSVRRAKAIVEEFLVSLVRAVCQLSDY